MGTLGALFGGVYLAMPSGKKPATQAPPINASSSDEADCIQWATPPSFTRLPIPPLRMLSPPPRTPYTNYWQKFPERGRQGGEGGSETLEPGEKGIYYRTRFMPLPVA